jgi:hypothetical protein
MGISIASRRPGPCTRALVVCQNAPLLLAVLPTFRRRRLCHPRAHIGTDESSIYASGLREPALARKHGSRTTALLPARMSVSRCRNSAEEAKHSTRRETELTRLAKAWRIEASSSTTKTIGSTDFYFCRSVGAVRVSAAAGSYLPSTRTLGCTGLPSASTIRTGPSDPPGSTSSTRTALGPRSSGRAVDL